MRVMRIAAAATVLGLGGFIVIMVRHEKRRTARGPAGSPRAGRVGPGLAGKRGLR